MLADRFDIRFWRAKERPTTGKEEPIEVGVPCEHILNDLDRLARIIVAGKRRALNFGVVVAVHKLPKSFDSLVQVCCGQTPRDNCKFALWQKAFERLSSVFAPGKIVRSDK